MSDHVDSTLATKVSNYSDSPEEPGGEDPRDTWERSPILRETFLRLYLEPDEAETFRRASRIVYLATLGSLVPNPAGYPPADYVRESLNAVQLELEQLSGFLLDVGMEEVDEPENEHARQLRQRADAVAETLQELARSLEKDRLLPSGL